MKFDSDKIAGDRKFFNSLGNYYTADSAVDIVREEMAGVACYWFMPTHGDSDDLIVYLHGGMFGLGSVQSHKPMVSHFATALRTNILFIEYALAPEKPFPGGLNDVEKVYSELIRSNKKRRITLIGDSAGGGLAVSLVKRTIDEKLPLPSGVVLISPWLCLRCSTESHTSRKERDKILNRDTLLEYADYYAGGQWSEADPSELAFNAFPPLLILVGSEEILFDDSKLFYEQIQAIQPHAVMNEYSNQGHVWLLTDMTSPASLQAINDLKEFAAKL